MNQTLPVEISAIAAENEMNFSEGLLESLSPPETLFGFTYHSRMVPPYKPRLMLVLGGYGQTIAGLTRKIWGEDVVIHSVDIRGNYAAIKDFFQMDAEKYISETPHFYDYIAIDLWSDGKACDFLFSKDFMGRLRKIISRLNGRGYVAFNIGEQDLPRMTETLKNVREVFTFVRWDQVFSNYILWVRAKNG